ncbi:MAG: CoA transferase [Pseudomonadota bacterium]
MSTNVEGLLLEGLKVLDLSQGIAGPYCASILLQQGADVVKVEPPAGDWARGTRGARDGFSPVVIAYNAGKRGLCIDAGKPDGRAVLARIAAQVDIVIQNFRPGVADRLGLGYDTLKQHNPGLIYLSISGFGTEGPYVKLPATDGVMQAMTGMMVANRDADGTPRRIGLYLADIAAAMYGSQLISAALYRRALGKPGTGGRHLQVTLLETCAALQACNILESAMQNASGQAPAAAGPPTAPSGIFRTADGLLMLSALDDAMFERTAKAIGRTDWISDSRFSTTALRLAALDELHAGVAEQLALASTAQWQTRLTEADVLHGRVNNYAEFLADPATVQAGLFAPVEQAGIGVMPAARHPDSVRMTLGAAPAIGEHTVDILQQFGYAAHEIDDLLQRKIAIAR